MNNQIQDSGRRGFLQQFLVQAHHLMEEAGGRPQYSLLELRRLPDAALARIVPVWRKGFSIAVTEAGLQASADCLPATTTLPLSEDERIALEVFAAGGSLAEIAAWLERRTGRAPHEAFLCARGLFFRLCDQGWAHPANDLGELTP